MLYGALASIHQNGKKNSCMLIMIDIATKSWILKPYNLCLLTQYVYKQSNHQPSWRELKISSHSILHQNTALIPFCFWDDYDLTESWREVTKGKLCTHKWAENTRSHRPCFLLPIVIIFSVFALLLCLSMFLICPNMYFPISNSSRYSLSLLLIKDWIG